jgi:hypothetical protein
VFSDVIVFNNLTTNLGIKYEIYKYSSLNLPKLLLPSVLLM